MITRKVGLSNKWGVTNNQNDVLSTTEDAFFMCVNSTNQAGSVTEALNSNNAAHDGFVTTIGHYNTGANNLDALSVNTFTFRADASDTALVITIESTDPSGYHFAVGNIAVSRGDRMSMRWNSNSVGTINVRGLSWGGVWT
jgi:hypothetical protein